MMLIVTILSLGMAAVSGTLAWRALRAERLRSAARVVALESAIDRDDFDDHTVSDFAWETSPLTLRDADDVPRADDVFEQRSSRHRTLLTAAVSLASGIVVIVLMAMFADHYDQPQVPLDGGAPQNLELLSMTHSRDGAALVVSGVVHNPSHVETAPLTTIVTALDQDGQIVAHGSMALTALGPGRTAPFTVRIEHPGPLGRYRVSFQTTAGVLPHIDRRSLNTYPHTVAE